MKMGYCLSFAMALLVGCSQPGDTYEMKGDEVAVAYLQNALDQAGTLEKWNSITTFSFVKETRMFLPDSSLESQSLQKQTFRNFPEFYGEIEYLNDSLERRIVQKGSEVFYYEKGNLVQDSAQLASAATNIQIAYYVIALPFKISDSNLIIEKVQDEVISGNKTVKSLQIQHLLSNGEKKDEKWWVYFDPESHLMQGYLIQHDGRYSYILNDKTMSVDGFEVPVERSSYTLDGNKENKYLRADYKYSDFNIVYK